MRPAAVLEFPAATAPPNPLRRWGFFEAGGPGFMTGLPTPPIPRGMHMAYQRKHIEPGTMIYGAACPVERVGAVVDGNVLALDLKARIERELKWTVRTPNPGEKIEI